jgi:hypothetical protein
VGILLPVCPQSQACDTAGTALRHVSCTAGATATTYTNGAAKGDSTEGGAAEDAAAGAADEAEDADGEAGAAEEVCCEAVALGHECHGLLPNFHKYHPLAARTEYWKGSHTHIYATSAKRETLAVTDCAVGGVCNAEAACVSSAHLGGCQRAGCLSQMCVSASQQLWVPDARAAVWWLSCAVLVSCIHAVASQAPRVHAWHKRLCSNPSAPLCYVLHTRLDSAEQSRTGSGEPDKRHAH